MRASSSWAILAIANTAIVNTAIVNADNYRPFHPLKREWPGLLVPTPDNKTQQLIDDLTWAFQPSTTYTYVSDLQSSSDTFSFSSSPAGNVGSVIDSADSSGFDANVTTQLFINTYADGQSPEVGTLLFQANMSITQCNVASGSAVGSSGRKILKSSDTEACVAFTDVPPCVWVTQNLTTGEFINVYYNASTQDIPSYLKLVVASLRALQAVGKSQFQYSVDRRGRLGNSRPETYRYDRSQSNEDRHCWRRNAQGFEGDSEENEERLICWNQAGGVATAKSDELAMIGVKESPSLIVEKAVVGGLISALLSYEGTASIYASSSELQWPLGNQSILDVGTGNMVDGPNGKVTELFFIGQNETMAGILTRVTISDSGQISTPEPLYNNQMQPFSAFSGSSFVQPSGHNDMIWALDTYGAIWGASGRGLWTNYTDLPTESTFGIASTKFWPWSNQVMDSGAVILGFFLADDSNPYVLFLEANTTNPLYSRVPSAQLTGDVWQLKELAPVAPRSETPALSAITFEGEFKYTLWLPRSTSESNPSDGFSTWQQLDLGRPVKHVISYSFPEGIPGISTGGEDGVLLIMEDSTVISLFYDLNRPKSWNSPIQITYPTQHNGVGGKMAFMGASNVAFDGLNFGSDPSTLKSRAIIVGTGDQNITTLDYVGRGQWVVASAWVPFENEQSSTLPPQQGYPAVRASSSANSTQSTSPTPNNFTTFDQTGMTIQILPFDDSQWMKHEPKLYQSSDILTMVNKLYANLDDGFTLVQFRRNISDGGSAAVSLLSDLITSQTISFANTNQSSAILSTILQGQTNPSVVNLFNIVINSTTISFGDSIRMSAIYQAIGMDCVPASTLNLLISLSKASENQDISDAATMTVGSFASKPDCKFSDTTSGSYQKKDIVPHLKAKASQVHNPEDRIKVLYGMANSREYSTLKTAMIDLDHPSLPVKLAALRAIGNIDDPAATGQVLDRALQAIDPKVRKAAFDVLHHHTHPDQTLASQTILQSLFEPVVQRTMNDLDEMYSFLSRRWRENGVDSHIARAGAHRIAMIKHMIQTSNVGVSSAVFEPFSWERRFDGSNAGLLAGVSAASTFDDAGATFAARAILRGSLFGTDFDLAAAGLNADWTSGGYMAVSSWLIVYVYDISLRRQVPFYVFSLQWASQTAFQLMQGDPYTLDAPSSVALSIRETRSFISATYYYGIPLIADVNIHIQLVGWFEVGYGVQLVTNASLFQLPGQVSGYIQPALGVYGEISANVDALIASAGIRGALDIASITIPVVVGTVVTTMSPFSAGFGDLIRVDGQFLSGTIDLDASLFWCCCFYCSWSCCFDCGGGCNKRTSYNILTWNGLSTTGVISNHSSMVASTASTNTPLLLGQVSYMADSRISGHYDNSFGRFYGGLGVGEEDSDTYCDCVGHYRPMDDTLAETLDWALNWPLTNISILVSLDVAFQVGVLRADPNSPTFKSKFAMFPSVKASPAMPYDCRSYPEVCQNTFCYFNFYPQARPKYKLTYSDVLMPRRRYSLSGLSTAPGQDRDEVPMNKCIEGGCCARIQAVDPSQNRQHGGEFCQFLKSKFGPTGTRNAQGQFRISFSGSNKWSSRECKNTDFRVTGGTWKQPSHLKCILKGNCDLPRFMTSGVPYRVDSQASLTLAGHGQTKAEFGNGDTLRVAFKVPLTSENEGLVSSRLLNLTLGDRELIRNGIMLHHLVRIVNAGPEHTIDILLAENTTGVAPIDSRRTLNITADLSLLMSHPDMPRLVYQELSAAKATLVINGVGKTKDLPPIDMRHLTGLDGPAKAERNKLAHNPTLSSSYIFVTVLKENWERLALTIACITIAALTGRIYSLYYQATG